MSKNCLHSRMYLLIRAPSVHAVYVRIVASWVHSCGLTISCLCLAWNTPTEILTYPGWGLLEEDRWVQLQDRFENLFHTKADVQNRWLRTENWFNSTYWYRVRISQVTKETSFAARIHSHSVCCKFSVGRLWRNCWRITSLSREILFFEYSSLKLVSREIFFVEAFIIPNPAPRKLQVSSFM